MTSTTRQAIYGLLAVAGIVLTWNQNIQFTAANGGFTIADFVAGGFVNHAAASLTLDIAVAGTTFMIWAWWESKRIGLKHGWVWVPLTLVIAFAFAFPLFLLVRERKLEAG